MHDNIATQDSSAAKGHGNLNRTNFTVEDSIRYVWLSLGLPEEALSSLKLEGSGPGLPSSFKVGHLAQASIALSALAAALIQSLKTHSAVPRVTVSLQHAVVEFKSERLYTLNGKPTPQLWGPIGGLHKAADGYVRIHDNFPHHRQGALKLLGCQSSANRDDVTKAVSKWKAEELETAAFKSGIVIAALRTFKQWDALPQARAVSIYPITIRKTADGPPGLPHHLQSGHDRCLRGLKVLELSRVIAAPVAGKTLAAHGADVIWITSPHLPDLPALDRDLARGKRSVQLDLTTEPVIPFRGLGARGDSRAAVAAAQDGRSKLKELAKDADVFIQSYRPGSLAAKGFSPADLAKLHPGIIYGTLSAYGPDGPWSQNRGFDSLIQTCSGMNVSEAEHKANGTVAVPLPCQALDHAAGYFLATGISAALYKKAVDGGSYAVDVSLAGTMRYLRSLGQYEERSGFRCPDPSGQQQVPKEYLEVRDSGFGELRAVRHSARVEGAEPGWDIMPKPLGTDRAEWL